jgi:pilus assembly protein CpaE
LAQKIRIVIADRDEDFREDVKRLLLFENEFEVIGEAKDGEMAISMTGQWKPDIVLLDLNLPVRDGLEAAEQIALAYPDCSVIIMSDQGGQDCLRRAMVSGAKDFLLKPFSGEELTSTLRRVYAVEQRRRNSKAAQEVAENRLTAKGKTVTVFSPKGGVGKTTLAVNMAVGLSREKMGRTVLIDLDLQFGDVAIMLNVTPRRSIAELAEEEGVIDMEVLEHYLMNHPSGLRILPAPLKPEQAEFVTAEQVGKMVNVLKKYFDYILIDTPPSFNDTVLAALDLSDKVILVSAFDLPTIKNIKLSLEIMQTLNYPKEKFVLVMNKTFKEAGIKYSDVESILGYKIAYNIPLDVNLAMVAVNKGVPLVQSHPNSAIGKSMLEVIQSFTDQPEKPDRKSRLSFGFKKKEVTIKL